MAQKTIRYTIVLTLLLTLTHQAKSQFLMDMVDTTTAMGKGFLGIHKKFDNFNVTGYIQPQFQYVESKGAKTFGGGDFGQYSDNRFMLRRGRIRFDYSNFTKEGMPRVQFVFQFDGTDKGVFARDFWGRLYDTKYNLFTLSAGIMPRPFGFEVNMGSADRESAERGRMSQTLMKIERDLGGMISFEPRKKSSPLYHLKIDLGLFNGQGLNTTGGDYDSYKDLIGRVVLKQKKIVGNFYLSGGINGFYGGLVSNTTAKYKMQTNAAGVKTFVADSSVDQHGKKMPRQYAGVDIQMKYKYAWGGATELRGEYWQGTNSGIANSSEPPANLPTEAIYIRNFNGAFIYFLQNIYSNKHQIVLKYDWFDPNTDVTGSDIGKTGSKLTAADVMYTTIGVGYNYYMTDNIRWVFWYDRITNEKTNLAGYTNDLKDDLVTCRLQFRF
jgi:hypothetical protein